MPGSGKITVTWAFCFWCCMMLLLLPLRWCVAVFTAAIVHELFHIAAVFMCGGRIYGIDIGIGGAVIHGDIQGRGRNLFCILAGPVGALILLLLRKRIPETAVCALAQSVFNLLPLPFLDGGRALRCVVFCKNSLQR